MLVLGCNINNSMAFNANEQFLAALERATRPLIILSEHADVDDFVSAFGIASLLAKLNKPVDIATSGGNTPKSLDFLGRPFPVRGDLPNIRKLTLHLNAKDVKVDELSYDVVGDELQIHLLPKSGYWSAEDVRVSADQYRYDLIIAIGSPDLESFGELFRRYADFFFNTPIINIDCTAANEHYGQMNIVDISAVSVSEVCSDLFRRIDASLIDAEVATFFLAGMIFKTKSFRSDNVTPKTLKVAGDLIAAGAQREQIVENLYKTRTVETLRLWGRALARLKSNESNSLVWTILTRQDFAMAGASDDAVENVIDELMMSSPNAKVGILFEEKQDGSIEAVVHAERPFDALYLGAPFRASGTREEARLRLTDHDLASAEKNVIRHVKSQL